MRCIAFPQGFIIPIFIHYSFVRSIFTFQNLSNSVLGAYFEIGLLLALLSKDSKLCKTLTAKVKKSLGNVLTHSSTFVKMCLILRTWILGPILGLALWYPQIFTISSSRQGFLKFSPLISGLYPNLAKSSSG
jgi:hypothetical protein